MDFSKELIKQIASTAKEQYLSNSVDPNQTIAKYASQHKLSAMQIDRIVAQSNRDIIVQLQKNASKDPHFTFDTAKTAEVINLLKKSGYSMPTTSPKRKIDNILNRFFPQQAATTRIVLSPQEVLSNGTDNASKEAIIGAISIVKDRLTSARREYAALGAMLDNALLKLEKVASDAMLENPIEVMDQVFESLPKSEKIASVKDFVYEKRANLSPKVDFEYEVDLDNPIQKLASEIVSIEAKMKDSELQIATIRSQLKRLYNDN